MALVSRPVNGRAASIVRETRVGDRLRQVAECVNIHVSSAIEWTHDRPLRQGGLLSDLARRPFGPHSCRSQSGRTIETRRAETPPPGRAAPRRGQCRRAGERDPRPLRPRGGPQGARNFPEAPDVARNRHIRSRCRMRMAGESKNNNLIRALQLISARREMRAHNIDE